MRAPALALAALALAALAGACGGDDAPTDVRVIVDGTVLPSPPPPATATAATPEAVPFTPTPAPLVLDRDDLHGFGWPLEAACLPGFDGQMPNAPRPYRNGVHEGVDWYDGGGCAAVAEGTPVLAMFDGVVVRADLDYVDITAEQVVELAQRTATQGFSDSVTLDIYRGRQVWIDHGGGIVTRYTHLGAIAEQLFVGAEVRTGEVIAFVGESGTPESVTNPGAEMHLHGEVRIDGAFLGDGLPAEEVRRLYERLFQPL